MTLKQTIDAIEAEIKTLNRPEFNYFGLLQIDPSGRMRQGTKNTELARWQFENPDLELRYARLREREYTLTAQLDADEIACKQRNHATSNANIGARASTTTVQNTKTKTIVERWHAGKSSSLLLAGAIGTGKTVAATWAIRREIDAGRRAMFISAVDLATVSSFDDRALELETIKGCPFLVVDDLGKENANGYASQVFFSVFDSRYQAKLRTIITSNLTSDELRRRYLPLLDRVLEDGASAWVDGTSMRLSPTQKHLEIRTEPAQISTKDTNP